MFPSLELRDKNEWCGDFFESILQYCIIFYFEQRLNKSILSYRTVVAFIP